MSMQQEQTAPTHMTARTALTGSLKWRSIGPHRGGRVVAVAGHPQEAQTFYFGACAGGVWKSTDAGLNWLNVSDGFFTTSAVGAIAVADSDPNVLYVGTGETAIRGNVSHGDGVYKSTDGGQTWANVGLASTRHISKIRVHPQNADVVYVAALGHTWGPNLERGVYRSTDGGQTWAHILSHGADMGAIDLSMDPHNPRILYAAVWNGRRTPHSLVSGGPGCGLWKSTDGGDTWAEVSRNPGFPTGVLGKIGVSASPAQSGRVYAIVEAEDGALFRSDDGGATWQRGSEQGGLRWRSWYYHHVIADPADPDTVYVMDGEAWKSTDGGKTFTTFPTPHGDNHDLWIDPTNPQRMINGNDGGACVSFNGGDSFSTIINQPTAQFYHVIADNETPYRVYGSQQDNSALTLPSFSPNGAITETEWFVPGGGESGYIAIHPKDSKIIFGGAIGSGAGNGRLTRYDGHTGQIRNITIWPNVAGMGNGAKELKYRFQWTFPLAFSPHDPTALYATSNVVHRTYDEGQTWEVVSPDLTRADLSKMEPSGGPITKDNTGAEVYGTIFAFVESPHEAGVFWAGSDDGLVHISRDGGANWANVTPPELPEWSLISIIEPSPHDAATAYVVATRYKMDDYRPLLYKTTDYGATWTTINGDLPADSLTRTLREDPARANLLYCGTETGVFVSFDGGAAWHALTGNLPVVPIHDLIIKGSDLILATHGRSFWILDDLSPLREIAAGDATAAHLFAPRPHVRLKSYRGFGSAPGTAMSYRNAGPLPITYKRVTKPDGETEETLVNAGENPPDGVALRYFLPETPTAKVTLTFLDANGAEIRTFNSKAPKPAPTATNGVSEREVGAEEESETPQEQGPFLPAAAGLNLFVWDMRYPPATKVEGDAGTTEALAGPLVVPGAYTARLTVSDVSREVPIVIEPDPRIAATAADYAAQRDLLLAIRNKLSETQGAILAVRGLRAQAKEWVGRFAKHDGATGIVAAARALDKTLRPIEESLIQAKASDPRQFPIALNAKIATLAGFVAQGDGAPAQQQHAVFAELSAAIDAQIAALHAAYAHEVAAFNQQVQAATLPAIFGSGVLAE